MPRPSSVERLPKDVLARLNFLFGEGGFTLDELKDWLDERGHDVSRSALGRHKVKIDKIGKAMRESQMMAQSLVDGLGPSIKDGQQFQALSQMMSTIAFRGMMGAIDTDDEDGDGAAEFDALEFGRVAKGIKDLVAANRIETDRVQAIKKAAREEVMTEVEAAVSSEGGSAQLIGLIRQKVMGTGG